MPPVHRIILIVSWVAMLFFAGCTAPDPAEDTDPEETPTETVTDAARPDPPEGAFFALGDASGLGAGDRAAVGFLDGDDRYDLYLAGSGGGRLYYGGADGGWSQADAAEGADHEGTVHAVAIGDLGDDDRDEIVLVGPDGMTILDNGDRSYAARTIGLEGVGTATQLALADLDNDGWLDAVVNSADGGLHGLFNDGAGGLQAPVALLDEDSDAAQGFALADVDDDLLLDLVVAPATGGLALWLNQPEDNGTFAPRGDDGLPSTGEVTGIFPVDLDNDRRIDLLVSTTAGLQWHENSGRVAFRDKSAEWGLPDQDAYTAPVAVDVDLDGWQDVLALDAEGSLRMWWNALGRGLAEKTPAVRTSALTGLAGGDLDRDGRIEFLGLADDAAPTALENVWEDGVWFGVHLVGNNTTTTGIGSKVELTIGASFPMFRQVGGHADPTTALPLDPHFGFGSVTGKGFPSDMALVILWPSGTFQGRDIPKDEGFDARVTARENTEELTWDEGGPC